MYGPQHFSHFRVFSPSTVGCSANVDTFAMVGLSVTTLVDILQSKCFQVSGNVLAIAEASLLDIIEQVRSDISGERLERNSAARKLTRSLARSQFLRIQNSLHTHPGAVYKVGILKVVFQDFEISILSKTWDAAVGQLAYAVSSQPQVPAVPEQREHSLRSQPSFLRSSTAASSIQSIGSAGSFSVGEDIRPQPQSRKRAYPSEALEESKEFQEYQHTFASYTWVGLLQQVMQRDSELAELEKKTG